MSEHADQNDKQSVATKTIETDEQPGGAKIALEFAPLVIFFACYKFFGIIPATAALVFFTLVSIVISYLIFRRIEPMPIVTAVVVTILGGLTIYLNDDTFVKMKPTIVYVGFGSALAIATLLGYQPIKAVLSASLDLATNAWTQLQLLWAGFFFAMALLNEYVWRTFSTDTWVSFKVFGFLPITLVFATLTIGYYLKHTESLDSER